MRSARTFITAAITSALLLCAGTPSLARAQSQRVIVVPLPAMTQMASNQHAAEVAALAALTDALSMQGLEVVDFQAARAKRLPGDRCEDRGCATRLLRAGAAELTATAELDDTTAVAKVRVRLLARDAHAYEGEAEIDSGDVRGATTRALLEARALQLLGPGPWLRVDGTPEGAQLELDERPVGTVPYRAAVTPGPHRLRVKANGYLTSEQELDVPAADRKLDVRVALSPAQLETPVAPSAQGAVAVNQSGDPRGPGWVILPIALGVSGVAIASATTVRLLTGSGYCAHADAAGRCAVRRTSVAPSVAYYAVSGALIGAAVIWLVLGSHTDTGAASDGSMHADIGFGTVSLSGSL